MKSTDNKKLAAEWFEKAEEDRKSIEAILKENGAPSTACFLSQQMAEKYLKGFLIYKGEKIPKIHDLIKIFHLIKKIDVAINKLKEDVSLLNRYYITTRYPADVPEGFSIDLAIQAFKSAKRIKNWVLNRFWKSPNR
jgi:HEPN domain-containing protein